MGYTVWIKIENDDGNPEDEDEGWATIAGAETRPEAVRVAEELIKIIEDTTDNAFWANRLDGWRGEE